MGKRVISAFASADGVVEDPAGDDGTPFGGWTQPVLTRPEVGATLLAQAEEADVAVYGRRTFAFFAERWPSRPGPLAERLNAMPKYVVASQPVPEWQHASVVGVDEVASFEGTAIVYGSLRLCRDLLARGVVDEVRLMVCPVLLGTGARLLDGTGAAKALRLLEVRDLGADVALMRYGSRDC